MGHFLNGNAQLFHAISDTNVSINRLRVDIEIALYNELNTHGESYVTIWHGRWLLWHLIFTADMDVL